MSKRHPNRIKTSTGEKVFQICAYVVLTILALSMIYPFINAAAIAFSNGQAAMSGGITVWPKQPTLDNFKSIFMANDLVSAAEISVFRTVVGTALHVICSIMCAFALSKRAFPGKTFFVTYLLIPTLFSGGVVPLYITLDMMGLTNNRWMYVLTFIFSFFNIIILRTYFEGLPQEIEEAATIDGCGHIRLLTQIIVPISLPVIATIALYSAVSHWNDWFQGEYYVTRMHLKPLQTILTNFLKNSAASQGALDAIRGGAGGNTASKVTTTTESLKMAILIIVTVPILFTYPFLQKYFIKGVLIGSVKG